MVLKLLNSMVQSTAYYSCFILRQKQPLKPRMDCAISEVSAVLQLRFARMILDESQIFNLVSGPWGGGLSLLFLLSSK